MYKQYCGGGGGDGGHDERNVGREEDGDASVGSISEVRLT